MPKGRKPNTVIYLDSAATSPVRREAIEAMFPYLTGSFGNPSSHHSLGMAAARALADAREVIASVVGAKAGEVTFTSGGTEADNLAIKGIALARRTANPRRNRVVVSAVEHSAVRESAEYLHRAHGFELSILPVDSQGLLDVEAVEKALGSDVAMLSVMYANNEIGSVQDLHAISALAGERGVPCHTDAVQAAGWLSLNHTQFGVQAMSLAGHKFGAPKGIGALIARASTAIEPLIHGGGQQSALRSGTENVAFAVAFATAAQLAEAERVEAAARVSALRDDFIESILNRVPGAQLTGPNPLTSPASSAARLPSIASFCFAGTHGESVLLELERRSVICSSGSACAAGSSEPSDVLLALGLSPELAQTAVRFSFPHSITSADLDQAADAVVAAVAELSRYGRN